MKFLCVASCLILLGVIQGRAALPESNTLFNPGFASGMAGWHGIGEIVYLKADGTESLVPVSGATTVLKIPLKRTGTREVTQEFTTDSELPQLHLHLEVCSSRDFKRSVRPDDYTHPWKANLTKISSQVAVPQSDLWIRISPGFIYRTASASPSWRTIDVMFKKVAATRYRMISFCVPCGHGAIYLRNPIVTQ